MTLRSATTVRDAAATAGINLIDAGSGPGTMNFYTGGPPASPQDAPTGSLLGTVTFSDPSFGAVSAGARTANAITDDSSANATGVVGWFRIFDSNGNAIFDGTVTALAGGGDIEFDDVNFVAGGIISVDSLVITYPQ
jgi:hypothetical protein